MTSKAYVTEYSGLMPSPVGGQGQVPMEPPLATQVLDFTSAHAESSAFNAKTRLVRVHTDSICSFVFGLTPVATTSDSRMAAGTTEYHGVPPTGTFKVSVISNT